MYYDSTDPIEAVHLTSFAGQTNHQWVTIVNSHHIAFTCAPAALTTNYCCYHEHYHVGARPLYRYRYGEPLGTPQVVPQAALRMHQTVQRVGRL